MSSACEDADIGGCAFSRIATLLRGDGLILPIGPYTARVSSPFASVARAIHHLYGDFPLRTEDAFVDFRMTLARKVCTDALLGQAALMVDGDTWSRFPTRMAPAYLEWGLNWSVFWRTYHCLVLHAATVERGGLALILPGESGSGKSTLCAALVHRGWRLLSDELAVISLDTHELIPIVKPIALKGASITAVRHIATQARWGQVIDDVHANRPMCHMAPPRSSVESRRVGARLRWVVFPKFLDQGCTSISACTKGTAFLQMVTSAFNYVELGRRGFDVACELIDACDAYELPFHDLDQAVECIEEVAQSPVAAECAGSISI